MTYLYITRMLTSTAWCWLRAEKTKKNCQKKSKKSEIELTKLKKCHKLKKKKNTQIVSEKSVFNTTLLLLYVKILFKNALYSIFIINVYKVKYYFDS